MYRKIDVSFVGKNYYHLMTSTQLSSVLSAAGAYVKSRWAKKSALNPKGSTGNFIVDFYYGREFNPSMGGFDVKLVAFRASMIALALINVLLVLDSANSSRGVVNGAVMATAAFQVSVCFISWVVTFRDTHTASAFDGRGQSKYRINR